MLIEFRILFYKQQIKRIMHELCRRAGIRRVRVPHLTVYGGFVAQKGTAGHVLRAIKKNASAYNYFSLDLDGVEIKKHHGKNGYFAYIKIRPSPEMERFRIGLIRDIHGVTKSRNVWDQPNSDPLWHITMAMFSPKYKVQKIKDLADGKIGLIEQLRIMLGGKRRENEFYSLLHRPLDIHRITILNKMGKIMYEYDMPTKKILKRKQALCRSSFEQTRRKYIGEKRAEL